MCPSVVTRCCSLFGTLERHCWQVHSGPHTQLALLWHSQLALQAFMSARSCSTLMLQHLTAGQQQILLRSSSRGSMSKVPTSKTF